MKLVRITLIFSFILFLLHEASFASSDLFDLPKDQVFFQDDATQFQSVSPLYNIQPFLASESNSSIDMGIIHKYLGYATLLLAGVTAITGSARSIHHNSAMGATTLGIMTLATGYYEYGEMFEMEEGFSEYNIHIALGTLGAIGFTAEAIIASTDSGHGGLGIGSAVAMGGAFIIIIW